MIGSPRPDGSSGVTGGLAEILRLRGLFGNLGELSFVFTTGNGGGIGHRSRNPPPGGVKRRKPGSQRGAVSGDTDELSAGGGE
ncbi:hypothetical protein STENM223S_02391 [Streptomyces tendae]